MFGSPSIANKKRGSVGTLTTMATSTSIPTTSLLGSQPAATSTSLFSAQPSTTSTPTNPLFGAQTSTTTTTTAAAPSLFGTQPSTTTASTPSLFGSQPTTTTAPTTSLFGAPPTTTSAPTNSLFGAKPITTLAPTNSLFGAKPSTSTNSLFGTQTTTNTLSQNTNNQQQPQGKNYLDLNTCFPDTKVPHFVVTSEHVTRTVVPANFFRGHDTRDVTSFSNSKTELNNNEPLSASVGFNERITSLPNYLTSYDNTNSTTSNNKSPNNFTLKKRVLEDEDMGRNTLSKNTNGIFSSQQNMTHGFDKNLIKQENQNPPVESLKDIGLQTFTSQLTPLQRRPNTNTENDLFRLFCTTSSSQPKKTKVRVFGYDQNNVQQIIQHFSNLGELSKPYLSQGNWIIFDYVSHDAALKAIQCNGMNIDPDHLVGVTWDDRAEEVEYLRYQRMNESPDLYKKSKSFLGIFNNDKDQRIIDKLREKVLGW